MEKCTLETTPQAAKASKGKKPEDLARIKALSRVALLAAVALILSFIETMIPIPLAIPGIKLGLANVAILVAFYVADAKTALGVAIIKVLAAGFLFGSPTMLAYSAGGTLLAFVSIFLLRKIPSVGIVPISMVSAMLHNLGQIAVAAWMMQSASLFLTFPPLALTACITGFLTGCCAQGVLGNQETLNANTPGSLEVKGKLFGLPERGAVRQSLTEGFSQNIDQHSITRPRIDLSSFSIEPGQLIAFIGPNGSGKTSAALQLAGLVDCSSTAFQKGQPALMFQNPEDQMIALLVADDVAFGLESQGASPSAMEEKITQALQLAGIPSLKTRQISTLSGGQKQRVSLAGALALDAPLLILDEPTSFLDAPSRQRLMSTLRTLCQQGLSVVLITHNKDEAYLANCVYVFSEGRIIAQGSPESILSQHGLLQSIGFEAPPKTPPQTLLPHRPPKATQPSSNACLQASNVSYIYKGGEEALIDCTFKLSPGTFGAIQGASGSGKTTLLRCLSGQLKPTGGDVLVNGNNLWNEGSKDAPSRFLFAQSVGFAGQMPEKQLFADTGLEDVMFGPLQKGLSQREAEKVASWALESLGLDPRKAKTTSPFAYSAGEQRRLAIAGIVACQPTYLLLDEPTAGLDPFQKEQLTSLLEDLASNGCGVLVATHDEELASRAQFQMVLKKPEPQQNVCAFSEETTKAKSSSHPLPFGVFEPGNTFVHRLHPGTKIVFAALAILAGMWAHSALGIGCLAALAVLTLFCSRTTPAKALKQCRPFLPLMVFIFLFDLAFSGQAAGISTTSAILAAQNCIRFIALLLATGVLMQTTSPTALADGIRSLLRPLAKEPAAGAVYDVSTALGLTFRFLSTLMEEFQEIKCSQEGRLARFDGTVTQRLKAYVPVLTVLFIRALQTADTLALALVNRGYGQTSKPRTCYRTYALGASDAIALLVALGCLLATFL